jgi:predicted Zn-dependent protease
MLQAFQLDPRDRDIAYAITVFYAQRRQWKRALPFAEQLSADAPDDPSVRQLLEQIRAQASSS